MSPVAITVAGETAQHMALLPLVWCAVLRARGKTVDRAHWLIAAALGLSWVAELPSYWYNSWIPSLTYPVSQSAIVASVIYYRRRDAAAYTMLVLLVGMLVIAEHGARGPDAILRAVAWLPLCYAVVDEWGLGTLRTAILVNFGIGFVMWLAHWGYLKTHPDLSGAAPTWYTYHATRLVGLLLFCRAATEAQPTLRVVRAT